jgi:hypothetical protein
MEQPTLSAIGIAAAAPAAPFIPNALAIADGAAQAARAPSFAVAPVAI